MDRRGNKSSFSEAGLGGGGCCWKGAGDVEERCHLEAEGEHEQDGLTGAALAGGGAIDGGDGVGQLPAPPER